MYVIQIQFKIKDFKIAMTFECKNILKPIVGIRIYEIIINDFYTNTSSILLA